MTLSVSEIPSLTRLYALKELSPVLSSTATPSAKLNDKVCCLQSDITKLRVDCIVNAANSGLRGGGGVDGAIHRAAGTGLLDECYVLNGCATGSAKITGAYELPCKKVIHAVGPVYWTTKREGTHEKLLRGCYRTSLQLAVKHEMKSIAFSALSTGVYGYPSLAAAKAAIDEVKIFLEGENGEKLDKVIFCNFSQKDVDAYEQFLPSFFPPVESESDNSPDDASPRDVKSAIETNADALAASLPDPPTTNPDILAEDEPDTKKQKLSAETSVAAPATVEDEHAQSAQSDSVVVLPSEDEEGWEKVEGLENKSEDGYIGVNQVEDNTDDDEVPVKVDRDKGYDDSSVSVVSSVADMEGSGHVVEVDNRLSKDW